MNVQQINTLYEQLRLQLERRAEEYRLQEHLKDLDAQRTDLERRTALFVPQKRRLERGGKALELGEVYEKIKELRNQRGAAKLRQTAQRNELTEARTALQNSEEALAFIEAEYRAKLAEQSKLENLAQRVKALDKQIIDRQTAAVNVRAEFEEADRRLKACGERVTSEQTALEKIEVALREARKFLQLNSYDEKLTSSLPGIQKCFAMYEHAAEKHTALQEQWVQSLKRKQDAQSTLNDRAAMFSEINHRYSVIEKTYARARAFYESTLKGKSIPEWRSICSKNITRLADLDALYKKFQELRDLEAKLKNLQDSKTRLQQETRNLNIRDVEQSGKINELQEEAERLKKRVELLHRIEDIDAVRELLQDGIPCPLCGSSNHPYVSGALIPDPDAVHRQLEEAQKALNDLRDELQARQARAGRLNEDIASIMSDESDLRTKINALNAEITSQVSLLGLKFSAGISPFEELDRERQKARDALQLARLAADTAESAELDMKAASDELEKITQTREEVGRIHQDALFALNSAKSEEEQVNSECKAQDEIVSSLKREFISQIMPYGYKTIPDKNPGSVVEALAKRLTDWQEGSKKCDELEHELNAQNAKLASLKKERESARQKREELASRLKGAEAERDSVKQQRVILFESRSPYDETARMSEAVDKLRIQLNERRDAKNERAAALEKIQTAVHALETEMAVAREDLQKHEIAFNKKLLALGFRNEDDYAASLLTGDERRDLQAKLRELTQTDFDLKTERENTRAKLLELAPQKSTDGTELLECAKALKREIDSLAGQAVNNSEEAAFREKVSDEIIPELRELMLMCGLEEVF